MLPWLLCAALVLAVVILLVRLLLLRKSLDEIGSQLGERLTSDTNNPIFLSTRDPHARKLAAELNVQLKELRRQRQRYENGDRELKESVTNISHDLRTPLTAICGYLELLERQKTDPDTARYLSLIENRVTAMKQLTEELFRYSVAVSADTELPLEMVDLNRAVEESVAGFYAALTERGIVPVVSMPEQRVLRRLNRAALSRVLGNILTNAIKYSSGDLEITLSEQGELSFVNTAPGMDEVQVGKLFDRFFTVETGHSSTGLGLSIAKALTERMGGTISIRYEYRQLVICLYFG